MAPNTRSTGLGRRAVLVVALVASAAAAMAQSSDHKPDPKADDKPLGLTDRAALAAVEKYQAAERKAHEAYQEAERKARKALVDDLTAAQTRLTKAGALEDAVAVKDAIAKLKDGPVEELLSAGADDAKPKTFLRPRDVIGLWESPLTDRQYRFDADGQAYWVNPANPNGPNPHRGRWTLTEDGLKFTWTTNGRWELYTAVGDDGWIVGKTDRGADVKIRKLAGAAQR
jgi:hypothetical protein